MRNKTHHGLQRVNGELFDPGTEGELNSAPSLQCRGHRSLRRMALLTGSRLFLLCVYEGLGRRFRYRLPSPRGRRRPFSFFYFRGYSSIHRSERQ